MFIDEKSAAHPDHHHHHTRTKKKKLRLPLSRHAQRVGDHWLARFELRGGQIVGAGRWVCVCGGGGDDRSLLS